MPDEIIEETPAPFAPVECSLGTWTATDRDTYLITTTDGRTVAIIANGDLTAENIEADIANPLPAEVGPRQLSKLELKARLDVLGKWAAFVTFLTSIGAWDDFILASFVSTDHPLFTTYAPQVKEGISLTDEEFDALIA
jgi:hypothetical protein